MLPCCALSSFPAGEKERQKTYGHNLNWIWILLHSLPRLSSNITAGVVIRRKHLSHSPSFYLFCTVLCCIYSSLVHIVACFVLSKHKPGLTILLNVAAFFLIHSTAVHLPADPNPTWKGNQIVLLFVVLSSTETLCLFWIVELCSVGGDNLESESYLSHLAMTTCKELFCLSVNLFFVFFLKKRMMWKCEIRCFDMMLSF